MQADSLEALEVELEEEALTGGELVKHKLHVARSMMAVDLAGAQATAQEARAAAEALGRGDLVAEALAFEAWPAAKRSGAAAGRALLREAREALPEAAGPEARGRLALVEAGLRALFGDTDVAASRVREALRAAEAIGSDALLADALLELHDLMQRTHTGVDPQDDLELAARLFEAAGDRRGLERARLRLADLDYGLGREEEGAAVFKQLAESASIRGDIGLEIQASEHLYFVALHRGELERAAELAQERAMLATDMGDDEQLAWALDGVAWAHLLMGDFGPAQPHLRRAREIADRLQFPDLLMAVYDTAVEAELFDANAQGLLRISQERQALWAELDGADEEANLGLAEQILRDLRRERRDVHQEARLAAARAEREAQDRRERREQMQRVGATAAVLLLGFLAILAYLGKRRAERMHARLREQTERAQRNEEARRRLEGHVAQLERIDSLGLLAAGIAHDFNNLLCGILGHAEMLQSESTPAQQRELEAILLAARSAGDLCERLLDYSRPAPADPVAQDLRGIVRGVLPLLEVGSSHQAPLQVDLLSRPVFAEVDRTGIEQVLVNLVSNARDESVGAKRVTLRAGRADAPLPLEEDGTWFGSPGPARGYATLVVEDDGHGMTPETLRRVFDPFFTTKFEGRGVGLSAAYGIVVGHAGVIHVDSAPGIGTTFTVYLPEAAPDRASLAGVEAANPAGGAMHVPLLGGPSAPEERDSTRDPASGPSPGERPQQDDAGLVVPAPRREPLRPRVLVVDDEPGVLAFVRTALENAGYEVLSAGSGLEGRSMLERNLERLDAVLLDYSMPDVDGPELLRQIRRDRAELPVVMMSGHGEETVRSGVGEEMIEDLLLKPFRLQELRATMDAAALGREASGS